MNPDILNVLLIVGLCFIGYIFFIRVNVAEGMTDTNKNNVPSDTASKGVAGNAATYAANLKVASVKLSDTLLVSKYRSDYETAVLNAEELINNLMLETSLSIDISKPEESIQKLVHLNQAKDSLNVVMKFIDST